MRIESTFFDNRAVLGALADGEKYGNVSLQAIDDQPTSINAIAVTCGLAVHRVLSTISVLEMRRLVRRVSGTQVVRATAGAPAPPRPR